MNQLKYVTGILSRATDITKYESSQVITEWVSSQIKEALELLNEIMEGKENE